MWEKFKEQIPTVIVTATLVIGAGAFMSKDVITRQEAALTPLREQNENLRAQADDNRRQIEATTTLLKEAIAQHGGEVFRTDEELQKLNNDRLGVLADAIAKKVTPALPPPQSPADVARMQEEQVDQVATRLTDNLRPMLTGMAADQKATAERNARQSEQLSQNLQAAQAAAEDALKLTHEVSTRYSDSFKDQGVVVRLLSLPANLVIDTAKGNLINSRERAKVDQELAAKMSEIEKRLRDIEAGTAANRS